MRVFSDERGESMVDASTGGTCARDHLALAGNVVSLVSLGLLAAGCAGAPATTSSPIPASSFAGWWFTSDEDYDTPLVDVHIVETNGALSLAGGGASVPLQLKGTTLVSASAQGTSEFTLLPGGRRMIARFTSVDGAPSFYATLQRGTQAKVNNLLNEGNMWELENAITRWREARGAYPPVAAVRPDSAFARTLRTWPTNPFTHRPVAPGLRAGDYRYRIGSRRIALTFFGRFFGRRSTSTWTTPK